MQETTPSQEQVPTNAPSTKLTRHQTVRIMSAGYFPKIGKKPRTRWINPSISEPSEVEKPLIESTSIVEEFESIDEADLITEDETYCLD